MESVVPWTELISLVEPEAPEGGRRGQQRFAAQTLLLIRFMKQWFKLSDPTMEESLHDMPAIRNFAGLQHWDEQISSVNRASCAFAICWSATSWEPAAR